MNELIDFKNFKLLAKTLTDSEVIKRVRLLSIFGNNGSEVIYATTDDIVFCFGENRFGCLGLGTYDYIPKPVLNRTLSGKTLIDIVTGYEHCIGLTANGQCYAWGLNGFGRLGIGIHDKQPTPQLIEELADKCVVQIACGTNHTIALTIDGQVVSIFSQFLRHFYSKNH
jgi:alpha-tubulin suppressor-like RCC1 family protein